MPQATDRRQIAHRELAQRQLAQSRILPFATRFYPDYLAGWAHKVIAQNLEQFLQDVIDKKSPRLMIFLPPQTGKSMLASDIFPSWALGKYPFLRFILTSYSISLPQRFSRYVRERVKTKAYQQLFPETLLHPEIQSAEHWETTKRGGFKAVGVGGSITGHGAEIIIVDDPFKDYEESQSETIREMVHNWYPTTLRTRLQPGGGILNINTRWHDDDLSGRLLRRDKENYEDGVPEHRLENWKVLSLPALAEADEYVNSDYTVSHDPSPSSLWVRKPGDALHPDRHDEDEWNRRKIGATAQQWSALYQQNPVPDSGDFFTKDDFVFYSSPPNLHDYPVYFAWDLAVGEKRTNDWTVGMAAALIPHDGINTLYILDMFRKRVRDKELYEAVVNMYLKYKRNASKIGLEYGQLFLAVERPILEEFNKHNISPVWDRELKPIQDKRVRATPARGWMQHHRIRFPKHAPWVETAMSELLRFDAGVNDDIVDALAWLVRMVKDVGLVRKYDPRKRTGSGFDNRTVEERVRDYLRHQPGQSTGFMSS